ncbi:lipase/acyltransferase domain-containing protein [Nucisporomicrobium flavum]|uniref:lipase/acyltransferase domain-containing protein n=1 Tax=Nucisporomicrobium flavum TaxID=2785915 RepID=UPI0018F5421B|nr:hypothetical protein [Nucisporomicrobium flavum]
MQRLKSLVVVLPGIGGSVLASPDGQSMWDTSVRELATALVRPGRLGLDTADELTPTGLVGSFTTFGPLLNITGYEGLTGHIGREFRDVVQHTFIPGEPFPPDVDMLLVPYDFRRSVAEAAERLAQGVHQALAGVPESARARRVIVVAHSMGGLVARYWIGALAGWRVCRALITLGTPHRGAPKALQWLVHGAGVGALRHPSLTRALRGWPSMYELLPQYPAVWNEVTGRPDEVEALPPSLVRRSRSLHAYAEMFATQTARARQVHDDIARAWDEIPEGSVPDVAVYFGRGHRTTNLVTLTSQGGLRFSKEDPPWRGNVGWAGDGTVPVLSAVPRELSEDRLRWRELPERHGELASTPGFMELLRSLNGEAVPTRGAGPEDLHWLGLDIEDVVPAGAPIPLGVRVPDGAATTAVHVKVTGSGRTPSAAFEGQLAFNGSQWNILLPELPMGTYRLRLEAQGGGPGRSLSARTRLVVLDPVEEAMALGGASAMAGDLDDLEGPDDAVTYSPERSVMSP